MTRFAATALAALLLSSCTGRALLVTDAVFRDAAPEIVDAWRGLGPWRGAQSASLSSDAGWEDVVALLEENRTDGPVLVGMALTATERKALVQARSQNSFLFLTSDTDSEVRTLSVRRGQAWSLVAAKAAAPGTAVAVFPVNASPEEIENATARWSEGGGGTLTTVVGADPVPLQPPPSQVFWWAGPETEASLASLPASTRVHGNPGLNRPRGAEGLTWRLARQGLGDFLWAAVHSLSEGPQFLPLETDLVND